MFLYCSKLFQRILFLFFVIIFCNLQGQIKDFSPYFKVTVSNLEPKKNEVITVSIECKAWRDFVTPYDSAYLNYRTYDEGIKIEKGEIPWKGYLVKDQSIKKELKLSFNKKGVYWFRIIFSDRNCNKMIQFFVDGAFEEDEHVIKMREAIKWYNDELIKPHNTWDPPDTAVYHEYIIEFPKLEQRISKEESEIVNKTKLKNSELLEQLRIEYSEIKEKVLSKRRMPIQGNLKKFMYHF